MGGKKRRILFVKEAYVAGEGEMDVDLLLIEQADGIFVRAKGDELAVLMEEYPGFLKSVQRTYGRR